jgi:uncharacterized protein (TIGR02285 family)
VLPTRILPAIRLLSFSALGFGGSAALAQEVALHYFPRPPYVVREGDKLTGLSGSVAYSAFKASGIEFALQDTPPSRFLVLVKRNTGMDCGVGWFKTPEREEFGKFTRPIYQDEPMVALTLAGKARIRPMGTVESLLDNRDLTLLVKQAFSYGKTLDALIEKYQPKRQVVTAETAQMVKMLEAQRADYMFISPEESIVAVAEAGFQPREFDRVRLSNMPRGESRYILCSKAVPDAIMARLNAALP